MTTSQRLLSFPPGLVRLLSRHKSGGPLVAEEIAIASTILSAHEVDFYSWRTDWDTIPTTSTLAFLRGCGLDIDDTKAWRRALDYLGKRPTFRYLRTHQRGLRWESYYLPLLKHWREFYRDSADIHPAVRSLAKRLTPLLK